MIDLSLSGLKMHTPKLSYSKEDDILHLLVTEGKEAGSVELSANITVELNDDEEIIGVEILNASAFVRNTVLDSTQAKLLQMATQN